MVWRKDAPECGGLESHKVRWELPLYTRGRVLDIGCGVDKAFPHFIGVDNCDHVEKFGHLIKPDLRLDANKLDLIADESCNACFSSHLLEHFPYEEVPAVLAEWFRVLKPEGFLILYVPDEDEYPKVGAQGANPTHKWNVNYDLVIKAASSTRYSWDLIDFQKRNADYEYSLFFCFKKLC